VAGSCDLLRTPQIEIDSITVTLDGLGGRKELLGIVCTELDDKRAVGWSSLFAMRHVEELVSLDLFTLVQDEHLHKIGSLGDGDMRRDVKQQTR